MPFASEAAVGQHNVSQITFLTEQKEGFGHPPQGSPFPLQHYKKNKNKREVPTVVVVGRPQEAPEHPPTREGRP